MINELQNPTAGMMRKNLPGAREYIVSSLGVF